MKFNKPQMRNIIFFSTVVFFFLSFNTLENYFTDYQISEDFSIVIKGDSNVKKWESSVKSLTGTSSISFGEAGDFQIETCELSIPVKSILSTKGKTMDKKTWKALKEEEYPNIEYKLTGVERMVRTDNAFTAQAKGDLTIAGKSVTINMDIKGMQLENGRIEISGSKDLKMTDFGINPPTALLGTMKTKDEICIEFRVVLDQT